MNRALLALVIGAAAGAATTYYFVGERAVRAAAAPRGSELRTPAAGVRAEPATSSSIRAATAERAALQQRAADADAGDLERLIAAVSAQAPATSPELALDVLLTRYAELDPERAIEIARLHTVDDSLLASLYATWAVQNPAGALAALSSVDDPIEATAVGLAMLPALGGDEHASKQVVAALPIGADYDFQIAAIAADAASDPAAALDRALGSSDSALSELALERVAAVWARQDVRSAVARADSIDDEALRTSFLNAALREWAKFDAAGALDYFVTLDAEHQQQVATMSGLRDAARLEPLRALEIAGALPGSIRGAIEQAAMQSLAQRDPELALRHVGRLPPGRQQAVRQIIARTYGEKDPAAALAWAEASGQPSDLIGVLGGIARKDVSRAFDVALNISGAQRPQALQAVVAQASRDRGADLPDLAERLLAIDDPNVQRNGMQTLMQVWPTRAPDSAVAWLMRNGDRVPATAFQGVAVYLGQNDLAAAERYFTQIPSTARSAWLQGVAQGFAQIDPSAAAAWIDQFRSEPGYGTAAGAIAQRLASLDAPAAARLLDTLSDQPAGASMIQIAASQVANRWAADDPLAAAEWARRLASDEARRSALAGVAQTWAANDFDAARDWAVRLPSGSIRDTALGPLLAAGATKGPLNAALLNAFSDDRAREQGVSQAIFAVAQRDPTEAQALIARHITDPARRTQLERAVEQAKLNSGAGIFLPPR
jgi:hypothetical protein